VVVMAGDGWDGWICAEGGSSAPGDEDEMAFSGSGGEGSGAELGLGTERQRRGCKGLERGAAGVGMAEVW